MTPDQDPIPGIDNEIAAAERAAIGRKWWAERQRRVAAKIAAAGGLHGKPGGAQVRYVAARPARGGDAA